MNIGNIGHTIAGLPGKIRDYAKERPDTAQELDESSPGTAMITGGMEGLIAGGSLGPAVAAGGAIGGYLGVKAGEEGSALPAMGRAVDGIINRVADAGSSIGELIKDGKISHNHHDIHCARTFTDRFVSQGSFKKAMTTAFLAGATVTASVAATMAAAAGVLCAPAAVALVATTGLMGGLSGMAGTLSGSRKAATRDGVQTGFMAGMFGALKTGNPSMMLAGAVAGGIGAKAAKPLGRAIVGALAGLVTGALTGIAGGPAGIVTGAVTGAVVGAAGAAGGPPFKQLMRNAVNDMASGLEKKIKPHVQGKLGLKGKTLLGSVAGALGTATLGLIAAPYVGGVAVGLCVASGIGALTGGIGTYKHLKATGEGMGPEPQVQEWKRPQAPEDQAARNTNKTI